MLDYLTGLVSRLGHWGYVIVFLVVMLECQAFLGLFMPAESLVIVSGFLAGQRLFDLDTLIFTVSAAAIAGDSIGYELGRHLGRRWLLRHGARFGIGQSRVEHIERFFARHGGKGVFAAHFMHMGRALMPFLAGSSRMNYVRFLCYNAAGCILWASVFVLLGYFLSDSWHLAERWIGRASAIVGVVVALVIVLAWLWGWIVRHETEILERWQALLIHPRVVRLRERFAPQVAFLQRRLSPQGYLGFHLTAGALVLIAACWLFGGISEDILTGDPLTIVDRDVATFLHARMTPWLTEAMLPITFLGSVAFLRIASAVVGIWLAWRRAWYRLITLMLVMPGGALLNLLLNHAFHRQRPFFENPLVTLSGYSFPSGHAMGSTLFYGLLAWFVALALRRWRWRVLVILGAFLVVLLIGFSRIYLGAHYLSDVLGAMAAGVAWLALCITGVSTLRRYRQQQTQTSL